MHGHIAGDHARNLIFVDHIPLFARWWDLCMNMALMKTTSYYSALSVSARDSTSKEFNSNKSTNLGAIVIPCNAGTSSH